MITTCQNRRRNSGTCACTLRPSKQSLSLLILLLLTLTTVRSFQGFVSAACDKTNQCAATRRSSSERLTSTTLAASTSTTAAPMFQRIANASKFRLENYKKNGDVPIAGSRDVSLAKEYERRKLNWADRYTNLQSLRETFGSNSNKIWGDLDAATARRLYKTLLPKALLELVRAGVQPEDLAPLAYQARVAAKLYARYRCHLPARVLAALFDGFRTLRKYGRFQAIGMTYDQVYEKYQKTVLDDFEVESYEDLTGEELAIRQICLKILESSCRTNENVDRWILPDAMDKAERDDLREVAKTLEDDVRKLLNPMAKQKSTEKSKLRRYRVLRLLARARRRGSEVKTANKG